MNQTCATCPVRDSAACAVLSEEERDALTAAGNSRTLKRGEMLFAAGDDEAACATLVSGALKVTAFDAEGNEQILSLVHPSGFIGELFSPFAHHDVVALTESRLCTFARKDIERAIETVSRKLGELEEMGAIVRKGKRGIDLADPALLRDISGR
jgi:CRP/FNR family transcriptional regulator